MQWTKTKKIIAISACVILAGAAAAFTVYEIQKPVEGIPKGWSVICGDIDQWNWEEGKIKAHSTTFHSVLASTKEYRDVTLSAVASTTNREASLAIRMKDALNGYLVVFGPSVAPYPEGNISLLKLTSGQDVCLGTYRGRVFSTLGQSAKIAVTAKGPWLEVRLNDVCVLRVKDATYGSGFIGLRIFGDEAHPCDSTFSNLSFH